MAPKAHPRGFFPLAPSIKKPDSWGWGRTSGLTLHSGMGFPCTFFVREKEGWENQRSERRKEGEGKATVAEKVPVTRAPCQRQGCSGWRVAVEGSGCRKLRTPPSKQWEKKGAPRSVARPGPSRTSLPALAAHAERESRARARDPGRATPRASHLPPCPPTSGSFPCRNFRLPLTS